MAEETKEQKVKIIVKKKKGGGGHHGGSWKVALADFMTAMMALFMCLWILAQSQEVRQAVAMYFRHPTDYEGKPDAILRGNDGIFDVKAGRLDVPPNIKEIEGKASGPGGYAGQTPETISGAAAHMSPEPGLRPNIVERVDQKLDDVRTFLQLKDKLWKHLGMDASFEKVRDQIFIEALEEGMVVQLIERPNQPLFEDRSENFVPAIRKVLGILSADLAKLPNRIEIDGHGMGFTDKEKFKWLGSAQMADLTRMEMERSGVRGKQITRVSGCADTRPLNPNDPADPLNRRITIFVHPRQWRPPHY
jgi:chemotaxis protein MotB